MFNWSGCYIGANTGGAWAHKDNTMTGQNFNGVPLNRDIHPLGSTHLDGWAYGGQIGCDYQVNNIWVIGIRGMWDGSDVTGRSPWPANTAPYANKYKIGNFETLVATFGYLLNPTLELYGLGGVAWVRDHLDWEIQPAAVVNDTLVATGSFSRTGYDLGIGLSWIFAPHWNLFVEYDHMGFGTKNIMMAGAQSSAPNSWFVDVKQNVNKLLVGFNFRN
jgi:outer membrane immunogenic protein